MKCRSVCSICVCLTAFCAVIFPQGRDLSGRIKVMKEELDRNFDGLQKEKTPPYYMTYTIDDTHSRYVSGAFGAVVVKGDNRTATLSVDVRTGSYDLDNSHALPASRVSTAQNRAVTYRSPLDESPSALKDILWRQTDQAYRNSVAALSRVESTRGMTIESGEGTGDFSRGDPHRSIEEPMDIRVDMDEWAERIRKFTVVFQGHPHITDGGAVFQSDVRHKYFVDTEGTVLSVPSNSMRLSINGRAKADDGMDLPLSLSYFGYTESDFPSDAEILDEVNAMIADLEKLRTAPLVDPYTGPVILSGKASGVFLHEILGHRLEGHRLKDISEGQTFKNRVGEPVLPEFISIIFDPTIRQINGLPLSGAYSFDDEGAAAEKVVSIQNGVLKEFLASRTPVENHPRSNGHGRASTGQKPVSRQSNLIVKSDIAVDPARLRQMLIEECRKQDKPFGLLFKEISSGQTVTGRSSANAFNVNPMLVYRIHADGRPDELVRGVTLIGTPLIAIGKIIATGSDMEVFNGSCGAESGSIPVAAVSPSMLISEIEVQRAATSMVKGPILPPPGETDDRDGDE